MIHSVHIYPTGKNDGTNQESIYFSTKEEKTTYMRAEWQFCTKEQTLYGAAVTPQERAKRSKDLLLKRVAFAKHMGYGRERGTKRWVQQTIIDPSVA